MKKYTKQFNGGYTLLFAVLLSALVLSIGLSILNISRKELILSSSSTESQQAFFAADTGAECAAFYDTGLIPALPAKIMCSPSSVTTHVSVLPNPGYPDTYEYRFSFLLGSGLSTDPCAFVTMEKKHHDPDNDLSTGVRLVTTIESRGYNTCDSQSPRRTERGVRMRY